MVAYLNNKTNYLMIINDPNTPVPDPKIWTKLTGVRRVEVKPKVKKRREVNVDYVDDLSIPTCARFFAEWYEDIDQSGKVNRE